jgi:hypothetical protein
MRAKRIRAAFHWAGIALAIIMILAVQWVFTAAAVYGVMWGIGWLIARSAGDRERIHTETPSRGIPENASLPRAALLGDYCAGYIFSEKVGAGEL